MTTSNTTGIKSSTTVLQPRISSQMKKLLKQFKDHVHSAAEIIIKIYNQGKRDKLSKDEIRALINSAVGEVMSSRTIRRKLPLELKYVEKIRIGTESTKEKFVDKMSAKKKAAESESTQDYDEVIRKTFEEKIPESELDREPESDLTTRSTNAELSQELQNYAGVKAQQTVSKSQVEEETQEIYQIEPKDYDLNDLENYDRAMLIRIVRYLHEKLELELKSKQATEVINEITPLEKIQNYCREHNIKSKRQYWEALSKGKIPADLPQTKRADYTYGVKWNVLLGKN
jgi:hypothetical protein